MADQDAARVANTAMVVDRVATKAMAAMDVAQVADMAQVATKAMAAATVNTK